MTLCNHCASRQMPAARFCSSCAQPLDSQPVSPAAEREEWYRAVIGPRHSAYYLRQFQRFDAAGKAGISWHWPAFFISFYWLLYRKLWLHGLAYFSLPYVLMLLLGLLGVAAGEAAGSVIGLGYLLYLLAILLLPPLYANAWYYRACQRKIAEARASSTDPQRQFALLAANGGTSHAALFLILAVFCVAVVGILAAIAIPAYHDYSQRARVAQAEVLGRSASVVVSSYYYRQQQLPSSLVEAGFATPLPDSVQRIELDAESGTLHITLAGTTLAGQQLLLVAQPQADGRLEWQCRSEQISDKYLPGRCREQP